MRFLRAIPRHGSGRSRAAAHQRCSCCSSNGPIAQSIMLTRLHEALPNARDLNEAFPAIPPGRVIRCANPSATRAEDVEYLLTELRVRDLIDLRAADEIREDDSGSALMGRTVMRSYRRSWLRPGQLFFQDNGVAPVKPTITTAMGPSLDASEATTPAASSAITLDGAQTASAFTRSLLDQRKPEAMASTSSGQSHHQGGVVEAATAPAVRCCAADIAIRKDLIVMAVRHNISLLDRGRYYFSLTSRIPVATTAAALLTNFVSKPAARSLLLPYVNGGGLPMLYEMLLESSRPEICQVMEVLLRAAESRHCAMFFCRAGKDRTGLVAALVLAVAGASEEDIVEDYARSDAYHRVALAGLESREELAGLDRAQFERAPPEVMRATLDHIRRRYGSMAEYLTRVGFGPDRQQRLRDLLTGDW
ncbi:hypothetical protein Vretimale_4363 [Volvox reticuliferus]|uniref:Tyrosine specific protein phosphatases domain-containing protein n=1 Tax=Volvox reticuliferus TaxID=1737510 RepID=A0A8J4DFJ5_9CHLO|nr:hypothetical protein Vretimale_4363 [Volvox reticuliferus]